MSKPTRATRFIHEAAARCSAAGVSVCWDSAYSTVCISGEKEEDIFMQGDEADTFIEEIGVLCRRFPSLEEDTAALALAEPYTECLWG